MKSLSRVRLLVTPWTAAYQAPPSKGFSRQEYWSGLPLPAPGVHAQFEQILDKRCKKTKTPNCYFWRAWNKVRVSGEKVEYCTYPLHTTPPKGWANHLSHSSGLTTGHTPVLVAQSCPTLCDPHGLYPARLLWPWNSPGKNNGVGSHSLLQGIFLTQGSNLGLLHCRQILYHLSHHRSPQPSPYIRNQLTRLSE